MLFLRIRLSYYIDIILKAARIFNKIFSTVSRISVLTVEKLKRRAILPAALYCIYLQPPHVLQFPPHFLTVLPVAENICPLYRLPAAVPQSGQSTSSLCVLTSSSNVFPHFLHIYCKIGIFSPCFYSFSRLFFFSFLRFLARNGFLKGFPLSKNTAIITVNAMAAAVITQNQTVSPSLTPC